MNFKKSKGALLPFLLISILLHALLIKFCKINFNLKTENLFIELQYTKKSKQHTKSTPLNNTKTKKHSLKINSKHKNKKSKNKPKIKKQKAIRKITYNDNTKDKIKKSVKIINNKKFNEQKKETPIVTEISNSQHQKSSTSKNTNKPQNNKALSLYRKHIISIISKNIEYPYLAKKRGYEGRFVLELQIDNSGKLITYNIIEAKGKNILKKEIIKTISSIDYPKHNFKNLKIKIPIEFKLTS
jgi:protein TonB